VYIRGRVSIYSASESPRLGAIPPRILMMRASIPAAILVGVLTHGMSACSDARSLGPTVGSLGKDRASSHVETVTSKAAAPLIRLQAGDKIKLTVFGEDKISGEHELDPSGYLSLPLAGTVPAAGLSKIELEQTITTKLRSSYLRDPKVTIDVVSYRPIYILGEVQKPGEYPYRSGLNVMSALAVAGGVTYRASNSRVMIQRFGERSLKEYALDAGVPIMPGDVVRLPERYF
jgi:protein involved in polysaccharide export with SLBB domain